MGDMNKILTFLTLRCTVQIFDYTPYLEGIMYDTTVHNQYFSSDLFSNQ